jgi:uncharacterized membrane protein YraQ (UPF0718 family)
MMCTCCAAPVAAGMRKQQVSMGGALAFWMGNPLLNPATLVFMGFVLGWQFALVRLVAGLATVLIVATLVQKWVKEAATQPVAVPAAPSEAARDSFFSRWLRALWTLFWNTIPVYILAVLVLGAARVWLFPHADGAVDNTLFWVIAMAIAGCLFVIPTAAEIPIVQTMMLAGMGSARAGAAHHSAGGERAVADYAAQSLPGQSAVADGRTGGAVRGDCRCAGAGVVCRKR